MKRVLKYSIQVQQHTLRFEIVHDDEKAVLHELAVWFDYYWFFYSDTNIIVAKYNTLNKTYSCISERKNFKTYFKKKYTKKTTQIQLLK